jgi:hypothetical protein
METRGIKSEIVDKLPPIPKFHQIDPPTPPKRTLEGTYAAELVVYPAMISKPHRVVIMAAMSLYRVVYVAAVLRLQRNAQNTTRECPKQGRLEFTNAVAVLPPSSRSKTGMSSLTL